MITKLFTDLHEWRDGKKIIHKAGTSVDLAPHVAEWVNGAVIKRRERIREMASKYSFTPEAKK